MIRQVQFIIFLMLGLIISCASKTVVKKSHDMTSKKVELKSDLNLKIERFTLKNGLTVIVSENHRLPIFSYYTFYKVGSKYEKEGITGASHFLEHMLFKGTKKVKHPDHFIEGVGGNNNAYTTADQTVYYENIPSSVVEKITMIEADRMKNLELKKDSFEKERLVVLEERKMRYENSPTGQLYQAIFANSFMETPYGAPVIGEVKDLQTVSRDDIYKYYQRFYAPNNAIVVIVGDVDAKKVKKIITKYYEKIPKTNFKDEELFLPNHKFSLSDSKEKLINIKGETPLPLFAISYKGQPIGTKKSFVLDFLSDVTSDYINEKMVNSENQSLSKFDSANYNLEHAGVFYLNGSLLSGKDFKKTIDELKNHLKDMCTNEINEDVINTSRQKVLVQLYDGLDTNDGLASFLGMRQSLIGDYSYYLEELKQYEMITAEELIQECKEMFYNSENFIVNIWDKN